MDNDTQRGTKRKRYEPPQEEINVRINGKLHHEMKEVHKASKKAKIFETQKVIKKLKDLEKKDNNTQAIEEYKAELTCLKGTEHDSIGNTALKSKLLKDRTLRENEDIITAMNKELEGSLVVLAEPGTTAAKIQSRLLSSKFLSIQVAASLEALRILLNPALKQKKSENDVHSPSDKNMERSSKLRKETSISTPHATNLSAKAPSRLNATKQDVNVGTEDWESGSINEGREESDDGWESGDIGPDDTLEHEDVSDKESESENNELNVKTKTKPSKNESTFLPSLSVGFIRGGSDDSDWSDAEGNAEPKKNRRGQRARRAIWEKKFGRNAHHKKREEEIKAQTRKIRGHTSKIAGSNNIRPAGLGSCATQGSTKDKSVSQVHHPVDAGWSSRAIPAVIPATGTLHPSWEAKRRLKEKQNIGNVASQGKKIKFS